MNLHISYHGLWLGDLAKEIFPQNSYLAKEFNSIQVKVWYQWLSPEGIEIIRRLEQANPRSSFSSFSTVRTEPDNLYENLMKALGILQLNSAMSFMKKGKSTIGSA